MAFNDRVLAYALRHHPEEFGLQVDSEGWVDLNAFLRAMRISREQLDSIMQNMKKQRFEIQNNKIRAFYGHSFENKVAKTQAVPPDVLYHGTSAFAAFAIVSKQEGLRPMLRQYVHLSSTVQEAINVGKRKDPNPVILKIDAKKAYEDGVKFYLGNENIWLADFIPANYISS
jgi:putative RNA 2'-phosphotransferase